MLGVVELKRAADAVDHRLRDAGGVAPLETFVILGAHAREQRDFLTTKPRNAAATAEVGQPRLLRREPRPTGGQELADVLLDVHASDDTPHHRRKRGPVSAPHTRAALS